jgi:hypothetical protein
MFRRLASLIRLESPGSGWYTSDAPDHPILSVRIAVLMDRAFVSLVVVGIPMVMMTGVFFELFRGLAGGH